MQPTFGQRVLLGLYALVLHLAFPITLYHLVWRGMRQREYLRRWTERYGWLEGKLDLHDAIWVHAVSVGEVIAARPLVDGLLARHPDRPLLVTTITPTGSERVRALWGNRVHHVYLPYDLRAMVQRFLDRARPALAVIVETEIWLNLYVECGRRGIPLVMVNARLSERSLRGYLPVQGLAKLAMRAVRLVAAQSNADATRLARIGADPARIHVTGNLKYDLALPEGVQGIHTGNPVRQAVLDRAGAGYIPPGDYPMSLVVIGGSGTGKSVLLKCILGLVRPDEGLITLEGQNVLTAEREAFLARFGMLFQGGALFDSLRVWENVAFRLMRGPLKRPKDEAREIAVEKLRRVGLGPETADLFPAELSGGMQKRVGLARAIAAEPEIIFFDEPTTGLDPIMAGVINALIREIVTEMGATAITITHDMTSVRAIADRVAMLHDGLIRWNGPVGEMDSTPDPYVQQFIHGRATGPIAAVR